MLQKALRVCRGGGVGFSALLTVQGLACSIQGAGLSSTPHLRGVRTRTAEVTGHSTPECALVVTPTLSMGRRLSKTLSF